MGTLLIKDLGGVEEFLGMSVELSEGYGYTLGQKVTIDELPRSVDWLREQGTNSSWLG